MGSSGFDDRPERSSGGIKWFSVLLVLFLGTGVGGYFWMHRNDVPADHEHDDHEPVASAGDSAGEGGHDESSEGAQSLEGSETGANSQGTGETTGTPVADSADAGSTATGGGDSANTDTSGSADAGGTSGGRGSGTSGGHGDDGGDKPPPRPTPDMSKLIKVGALYTAKATQASGNYAAAAKTCKKLRRRKHGRLTRWRMATTKEISRFASSGVRKTKYWGRAKSKSSVTAPAINLTFGNKVGEESRANSNPRAFCVSGR